MLRGRLGIESARVPHADRHGLLWLSRGRLYVEDDCLRFGTAGDGELPAGDYAIPVQSVSGILLGPGAAVTHDALRLLARQDTALAAVGDDGVRLYASMPFGPDASALARRQAIRWADHSRRIDTARRMYAWRLGEILPVTDLDALRGIEGARVKEMYKRLAEQYGIWWFGRKYDRNAPEQDDPPNQAINHASTAVLAAAQLAVALTGAIPQLGFIHEDSGVAFALDVADLYRDTMTVPIAFSAVRAWNQDKNESIERHVRRLSSNAFRQKQLVPGMIDRIKELFDDRGGDPKRP